MIKIIFKRFFPTFIWATLIYIGSATSGKSVSDSTLIDFLAHKIIHFGEYFIFYLFLYRAVGKRFWPTIIILTLYAVTDETHQQFVPGRASAPRDVIIDVFSGLVAAVAIWKLLPTLPEKLKDRLLNLLEV